MKRIWHYAKSLFILTATALLTACSTVGTLSEAQQASLIEGEVFSPDTDVEYVPYEVIRYVYPEDGVVMDSPRNPDDYVEPSSPDSLLNEAIDDNTVSVGAGSDFYNTIVEYSFQDGKIYDIFTAPRHVTDIRLAPGETISGEAAIGDSESWQMVTAVSNEQGRTVTHIYVKPVQSGLETSMIIPTDSRTYYLRLLSYDELYMVGVRWKYPGIYTFGSKESFTSSGADTGISVDVSKLNYQYEIKGDNTVWKPVAVYDDGIHTYFQFDPRFSISAGAPSLYLLPKKSNGKNKAEVVNYVVRGNLYIADFVLQDKQAWFLMTDKDQVKITKD